MARPFETRVIDMTGEQIGFLTVLSYAGNEGRRGARWLCRCVCGKELTRRGNHLRYNKKSKYISCGCQNPGGRKHGFFGTKQYKLWCSAKDRANKRGLPFSIEPADVLIPEICPVLGIKLELHSPRTCHASPTIDRIDGAKGYVKGNIRVISHRANTLKNDATVEELLKITEDAVRISGQKYKTPKTDVS